MNYINVIYLIWKKWSKWIGFSKARSKITLGSVIVPYIHVRSCLCTACASILTARYCWLPPNDIHERASMYWKATYRNTFQSENKNKTRKKQWIKIETQASHNILKAISNKLKFLRLHRTLVVNYYEIER